MTSSFSIATVLMGVALSLACGVFLGIFFGRRGVGPQIATLRAEMQAVRDDERQREGAAHNEAICSAAIAHEKLIGTLNSSHNQALATAENNAQNVLVILRQQLQDAMRERTDALDARSAAEATVAETTTQLAGAQAQLRELRDQFEADRRAIEDRVREVVQTATTAGLVAANKALLDLGARQFDQQRAETMKNVETATKPLTDGLQRLHQTVVEFDKMRVAGDQSLKASLEAMARKDEALRQSVDRSATETAKLSTALRDNRVRGRWGEIGLRNVLEKVGLTDFCDFVEQAANLDGRRPDVIIALPGDREVAVDSKVPFEAYMSALEATDPAERDRLMLANASALRSKVRDLASRGYHNSKKSIGLTILYVQIESVVSAALSSDPALVEDAIDLGIVIATPATLIAYLRSFSFEWSLHKQSENADVIVKQAREMVGRLVTFAEKFALVGAKLSDSVGAWNGAVASFDGRLVVTAKSIASLSGTAMAITKTPISITASPRHSQKTSELESLAAAVSGDTSTTTQFSNAMQRIASTPIIAQPALKASKHGILSKLESIKALFKIGK